MEKKCLNIKNSDIIVKDYTTQYRETVIEFLKQVAIEEFGFKEWKQYFNEALFFNIDDKEAFLIAINEKEEIVGTIGVCNDKIAKTAKIHSFYVRKDYRRKGIGTLLYKCSWQFIKDNQYKSVILHTYNEFDEAIKFYRKNGFKINKDIKSKDGFWFSKDIEHDNCKWNDYFANLRNKYNMRVSLKKALVINLDGKGTTNNVFMSLLDRSDNGFLGIMEKSVRFFSYKYNCLAIFGTDEVSFIFEEPAKLISDISGELNTKTDEIISMFSQYFFQYFNSLNNRDNVFWHGECFCIPNQKINSYIKYKSGAIKNVLSTYFLKKNNVHNAGKIKLSEKLEKCSQYSGYEKYLKDIEDGILYFKGERIKIYEFLNGNIKLYNEKKVDESAFSDLLDF